MATIKIKNNINSELAIIHHDDKPAKSIIGTDIAVAVDTINDFPLDANDGDTVIVRDLDRGGTFIYDSSKVAGHNDGTNFNGWIRQYNGAVNVKWFGAKGDGVADDTVAIQKVFSNFSNILIPNAIYFITSTITTTSLDKLTIDVSTSFKVDSTNFSGDWVFSIGDNTVTGLNGRNNEVTITGMLNINSINRANILNGIYLKGSYINTSAATIKATNFNGTGIYLDTIWDSLIGKISAELCGNTTDYAINISSNGDTFNTTNILSIQSEKAYHRSIYINAIRTVINNIHAERTYVLSNNDGSNPINGKGFTNVYILLQNSLIQQGIFDAYSGTTPDGISTTSAYLNGYIGGYYCSINSVAFSGYLFNSYSDKISYNNSTCIDFYSKSPALDITINSCDISGILSVESVKVRDSSVGTFLALYNCRDVVIENTKINDGFSMPNNIMGNIKFNNCIIECDIGETKDNNNYNPVTFNNCTINGTVLGAYNAYAIFNNCYIDTVNLASRSIHKYVGCVVKNNFTLNDNKGTVTLDTKVYGSVTWATPNYGNWKIGQRTQKLSSSALASGDAVEYICTDSSNSWTSIVSVP